MYWLLEHNEQEQLRTKIIKLQTEILSAEKRKQDDQVFPFIGRKNKQIAEIIIRNLTNEKGIVIDPFSGSGTFLYAGIDKGRKINVNEWEPYAYNMSKSPLKKGILDFEFNKVVNKFKNDIGPIMMDIYKTKCPKCGKELMFDGLFFDREPEEYFHPVRHERMGKNGENIIFRNTYKCSCKCSMKFFDSFDQAVLDNINKLDIKFPNPKLIENSRLNFTAPNFIYYKNLFSKRQQVSLIKIFDYINGMDEGKEFFMDTFLSIIHLGKYTDYRSKSQDNHCPSNRLKETNLYHRFLEKLKIRYDYISSINSDYKDYSISNEDYRCFFSKFKDKSVDLVLTDPPYGDNAQYFEHAQRVHPFMNYNLAKDKERLSKEVVMSNAPSRIDKHSNEQFMDDIENIIKESSRVTKEHGFVVLYFRPQQSRWITDLNKLKHYGRKYGMEPICSIPIDNGDPSMRALASAAWSFKSDVCFIFIKLSPKESRWYEGDIDIDELVYIAAKKASGESGNPFLINTFNSEMLNQLRKNKLLRLVNKNEHILTTLSRFTIQNNAQYRLTGLSPYEFMNREMNAEIRLREFAPIVIEELTENNRGFTFEEYVIHLSTFMENGSREIIDKLHTANRLIPELLLTYAKEDKEKGLFFALTDSHKIEKGKISIRQMDPGDFEDLIGKYFSAKGYVRVEVIGKACDRGVDVIATNCEGQLELIQCKRYRKGNNVGSTAIQRVDSYMRSRNAVKAWVITTSDFTREGKDEARITGVTIVNGESLIKSLNLYFPNKYTL